MGSSPNAPSKSRAMSGSVDSSVFMDEVILRFIGTVSGRLGFNRPDHTMN
jgi:hypothetical protein